MYVERSQLFAERPSERKNMPDSDGKWMGGWWVDGEWMAGGRWDVRMINEANVNTNILDKLSSRVLPPLIYDLLECSAWWRFFSPMNLG
jgi:hypothetical protein